MFKDIFLSPLVKKKKRFLGIIIIMTMIISIMVVLLNYVSSLSEEIINLKGNIDNRKIQIQKLSTEFDLNKLDSDSDIIDYYVEYDDLLLKENDKLFKINYLNNDEYRKKILKGRPIETNENRVIIIPDKIILDNGYKSLKKMFGKTLNFEVYKNGDFILNYSAKVIGIYKNDNINNLIYIPKKDYQKFLGNVNDYTKMNIVINNYKNLEKVINTFKKNYDVYINSSINTEILNQKSNLYNILIISICFIFLILLIIFMTVIKNIEFDLKKDIILLRILGYSNFKISCLLFKTIFVLFFISGTISMLIDFVFLQLFEKKITYLTAFNFLNNYLLISSLCIILLCISIMIFYFSLKNKNNFISELNEKN